jgi:hypothetical protein
MATNATTTESANVARSIAFVAVNIAWRLELATIRAERPRDNSERAARRLAERAAADTMCYRMAAVRADYWEAVAAASRAAILRRHAA